MEITQQNDIGLLNVTTSSKGKTMSNSFLYLITVLIWGSTWIAINYQLGDVAPEASVSYRFLLAAIILFVFAKAKRLPMLFFL